MSKAFVNETDDEADLPDEAPAVPARLQELHDPARPPPYAGRIAPAAASRTPESGGDRGLGGRQRRPVGNGDYIYGKRRLREIDRRIRFLTKRLESAEVVDPRQQKRLDQVFFGATVTYAAEDGAETTITIVGIDEADFARGQVSWVSPIARALIKAHEGDTVELRPRRGRADRSARNPLRHRRWRDRLNHRV